MPELRKDPFVERWVIMAPDRAKRPINLNEQALSSEDAFDPFAAGNEASTPNEILACRDSETLPDTPGWRVRVIPNKYPALVMEGELAPHTDGLYRTLNGLGTHDVIIECPHAESNLGRLPVQNIREVLWVYRQRLRTLSQDSRLAHALIFKNQGLLAGASLSHSHSQLIATPVVPILIQEELAGAQSYWQSHQRSLFTELLTQELATGSRVVRQTARFAAICPYASRFPYETWILPRQPISHFEQIDASDLEELSELLKFVLQRMELILDDPPLNYVLHSAPFQSPELSYYSWHLEIFPRLTRTAGFEWGSGYYINPVLPEEAAQRLRDGSESST